MGTREGRPKDTAAYLASLDQRLRAIEIHRHPELPKDIRTVFENFREVGAFQDLNFVNAQQVVVRDGRADVYTPSGSTRWGTVVVAANNTHQAGKDAADFVADGVDDQDTINGALSAAGGGRVVLLEGTFEFSAPLFIQDGMLEGMGMHSTILRAKSTLNNSMLRLNSSLLRNVNINMGTVPNTNTSARAINVETAFGSRIEHVFFGSILLGSASTTPCAINLNQIGAVVNNCWFQGCNVGIHAGGTNIITNNYFDGTSYAGIRFTNQFSGFMTVANNGFFGCGGGGTSDENSALYFPATNDFGVNVTIANNIIYGEAVTAAPGTTSKGICIEGGGGYFTGPGGMITGNRIIACGREGIAFHGGTSWNVTNNFLTLNSVETTNTYDAILLTGNTSELNIQQNVIRTGHRYGINIDNSACADNIVTNNDLLNSGITGSFNDAGTGTITTAGNRL